MSLDLERMRYWLRQEMGGLDSTDLPNDDADELLNMALWDLEDKFPFKAKEQLVQTNLVIDQYEYDLSTVTRLDAIHSVTVIDSDGKRHKLARMTRDWLDENADFTSDTGQPTRYLREEDTLIVHPVPDEALDLEVAFKQSISELLSGSVEATGLPRNWDEITIRGAVWRGHASRQDYNLAQQAANFQIGLIRAAVATDAKEERDSRYARLEVIWDYPEEAG